MTWSAPRWPRRPATSVRWRRRLHCSRLSMSRWGSSSGGAGGSKVLGVSHLLKWHMSSSACLPILDLGRTLHAAFPRLWKFNPAVPLSVPPLCYPMPQGASVLPDVPGPPVLHKAYSHPCMHSCFTPGFPEPSWAPGGSPSHFSCPLSPPGPFVSLTFVFHSGSPYWD